MVGEGVHRLGIEPVVLVDWQSPRLFDSLLVVCWYSPKRPVDEEELDAINGGLDQSRWFDCFEVSFETKLATQRSRISGATPEDEVAIKIVRPWQYTLALVLSGWRWGRVATPQWQSSED